MAKRAGSVMGTPVQGLVKSVKHIIPLFVIRVPYHSYACCV